MAPRAPPPHASRHQATGAEGFFARVKVRGRGSEISTEEFRQFSRINGTHVLCMYVMHVLTTSKSKRQRGREGSLQYVKVIRYETGNRSDLVALWRRVFSAPRRAPCIGPQRGKYTHGKVMYVDSIQGRWNAEWCGALRLKARLQMRQDVEVDEMTEFKCIMMANKYVQVIKATKKANFGVRFEFDGFMQRHSCVTFFVACAALLEIESLLVVHLASGHAKWVEDGGKAEGGRRIGLIGGRAPMTGMPRFTRLCSSSSTLCRTMGFI